MEAKKYYSMRNNSSRISFGEAVEKFKAVYRIIVDKKLLIEKTGIASNFPVPDDFLNEARLLLPFQPFPIVMWDIKNKTIDNLFDTIEFLFDYVSQPIDRSFSFDEEDKISQDDLLYAAKEGQAVYREYINMFLNDFEDGYELDKNGQVVLLGSGGMEILLAAPIIEYDFEHVDKYVVYAITQWKKRSLSLEERKSIITGLANIFEWIKKNKDLEKVLNEKDDKLLFEIANSFAIRHHNPNQKGNYDTSIWYSWMFHFYLATYNAVIRLIAKKKESA